MFICMYNMVSISSRWSSSSLWRYRNDWYSV